MHPFVRAAVAAAVLTSLGSFDRPKAPPSPVVQPPARGGLDGMPAPCGPGMLPEGPVCLRLPKAVVAAPSPRERPRDVEGDRIPRRPDRPSDPAAYVYPVGNEAPPHVLGGFPDIPSPGSPWPTGEGIEIAASKGAEVIVASLEHQEGPAEVVFAGELYGPTVALLHTVREGARSRGYLAIYGYLDRIASAAAVGAKLESGNVIGAAGDAGALAGGLGHIYLETRAVREGVVAPFDARKLTDTAASVPCDARNVLVLRAPAK